MTRCVGILGPCFLYYVPVTVAGDPCQLGAVMQSETDREDCMYEMPTWRQTVCGLWGTVHFLTGVQRHADDLQLLHVLRRIRVGQKTDEDIHLLHATSAGVADEVWGKHSQLRATNSAVNAVIDERLARLPGPSVEFSAVDEVFVTHLARQQYAMEKLSGMVASK